MKRSSIVSASAPNKRDSVRSVSDMELGEHACLAGCMDPELALLFSERGLLEGTTVKLCWRAFLGGTCCVEACSSRFSLRATEAKKMLLLDA